MFITPRRMTDLLKYRLPAVLQSVNVFPRDADLALWSWWTRGKNESWISLKWYFLVPFKSDREISFGAQNWHRIAKPRLLDRNVHCSFKAVQLSVILCKKVPIRGHDFDDWNISVYSLTMIWVIIMNLSTNLPCWKSYVIYLTNTQQSPKWTPRFAWIICSFFIRLRTQLRRWRLRWLQLRLESFIKKVPLCRCSLCDDVSLSLCVSSINFTSSILLSR